MVSVGAPQVYYNSTANTWTLSCSGTWLNDNWNQNMMGNVAGLDGFGFEMPDEIIGSKYVGYKWYGSATYPSNFANFNANAKSFYVHTYYSAVIQSMSLGIQGISGYVDLSISNNSYYFKAQSNPVLL